MSKRVGRILSTEGIPAALCEPSLCLCHPQEHPSGCSFPFIRASSWIRIPWVRLAAVSAPLARAGCARGQQEPSLGRQMCREFYWLRVRAVKSPSLLLCSFYFCAGSSGVVLPPLEREPLMPTFFNKKCDTC